MSGGLSITSTAAPLCGSIAWQPVRRRTGEPVQQQLQEGDDPELIARRLTKEYRRHLQGDGLQGFGRRLVYPKTGVA
jgi:hypothetical protein